MRVIDPNGLTAPRADPHLVFKIDGPGEIVARDNGDPTSFKPFPAAERKAFNGLCLVILRAKPRQPGQIQLTATGNGFKSSTTSITAAERP